MPNHHYYLKLRLDYLDNPQLGTLPEPIQLRYYKLYMLAKKSNAGGAITMPDEQIAWSLHISADELQNTYELLPEILPFELEQIAPVDPTSAERQERYRKSHQKDNGECNGVTDGVTDETFKSQELRVKSQESEVNKESVSPVVRETTDDMVQVLKLIGIPVQFREKLLTDPQITREVLIAELTRNYARKGKGKGKVAQPGYVTGLNLTQGELPGPEWYDQFEHRLHLPGPMLTKLGIDHSEEPEKEVVNIGDCGYTKDEKEPECESERIWSQVLKCQNSKTNSRPYLDRLNATSAIAFAFDKLTVFTKTKADAEWLTSRATAEIERDLAGILDKPGVKVEFLSEEAT
jgi:hypothetical protein